jgi:N-succinyldiaminopimelate aminotransferase
VGGAATTIFTTMTALAAETGAINLGQGYPDFDGPPALIEAAVDALRAGHNQYAPLPGVSDLREAVAAHQARRYGLEHDPLSEIQVTFGATEALASALLALVGPGDEVAMLDPSYDSYGAVVALAGAKPVPIVLEPPGWRLEPDALAQAITPRTRMIIVNSPHNPTGRVLDRGELELLAAACIEHDLLALTDEVYEHLVFDGAHVPLATLPGMAERTVSISSGGKTFSFTGWKVGWVSGPAPLVAAVRAAKQFLTYTSGAPFQLAIARGLALEPAVINGFGADLRAKRDLFCDGLRALGFTVHRPAATYFATTDIETMAPGMDAHAFCRALPQRCGVVAIPSSVFYDPGDPVAGRTLVRWAFCKRTEVLEEALARLAAWG